MRKEGLEPPYPFGYQILSLARLPVPPLSRNVSLARPRLSGLPRRLWLPGCAADMPGSRRRVRYARSPLRSRLRPQHARTDTGETARYVRDDELVDRSAAASAGVDRPPRRHTRRIAQAGPARGRPTGTAPGLPPHSSSTRPRTLHARTRQRPPVAVGCWSNIVKPLGRVAGEARGTAQAAVRRIAIDEIAGASLIDGLVKRPKLDDDAAAAAKRPRQREGVRDRRCAG